MKKIIFLSFLLTFSLVFAQEKDTLSTKSFKELSIAVENASKSNMQNALVVSNYYLRKAKKQKDESETLKALAYYTEICIKLRKFNEASIAEKEIETLAKKLSVEKSLMRTYYLFGNAYFFQGVWSKSTAQYQKALEIAKQANNTVFQNVVYTQLGYLKSTTGDYKEAIKYQKEALDLIKGDNASNKKLTKRQGQQLELSALYYITMSYISAKEPDSATIYLNNAFKLNTEVKDSCLTRAFFKLQGELHLLENKYSKALESLKESKKHCLPFSKGDSLVFQASLGKAYLGLKKYDSAVYLLQKALDDYKVKPSEEGFMQDHYKLLAKAYKHTGNIEKSNLYFEKYIYTTDEFSKIQDTVAASFKKQEIEEFEAELNAIQSEKDQQKNYIKYLALGATLVILILLFFLLKFYKDKKKKEQQFKELYSKVKTSVSNTIVDTKDKVLEETNAQEINNETQQQILEGLKKLEEQEYFLKLDCNAYNVAKKIKTNTSYLSKVVNSHYLKNFNTYINDYRINYAIVRLKNDSRFRSFSIQSIAQELGYKSADSFTKYFKQHTGLNPSFYIKQLNNLE